MFFFGRVNCSGGSDISIRSRIYLQPWPGGPVLRNRRSFIFILWLPDQPVGCADSGYCFIASEAGQGRLVAKGFSPLQYPSVAGEDIRATAFGYSFFRWLQKLPKSGNFGKI